MFSHPYCMAVGGSVIYLFQDNLELNNIKGRDYFNNIKEENYWEEIRDVPKICVPFLGALPHKELRAL